jgi:SagB-type dehydrogenase family enzyme
VSDSLFLSLRKGVGLEPQGAGQIALKYGGWTSKLSGVSSVNMTALRQLGSDGEFEDCLTETVLAAEGIEGLAKFYYYVGYLSQRCLLRRSVYVNGRPLATLMPISFYFGYASLSLASGRHYRLSRFAFTRAEDGETILESPLSYARMILHDWRATALVHDLARPRLPDASADPIPMLPATRNQLMTLLLNARMLTDAEGTEKPLEDPSLRSWEFHDLLFHSRSRIGRHDLPVGGTYRFVGELNPPRALKSARADESIPLYRPDLEQLKVEDPPFALVQETRRSIREFDAKPITLQQLGEFLYRVGRVTDSVEMEIPTPSGPVMMDFARRPYPGGGALYELELYPAVRACENLAAGIYHYEPQAHRLERISSQTVHLDGLLSNASVATGIPSEQLQVLIVITSRFQRLSWKYASMAYALTLKHAGVLYQTMYLVATAMKLAPCGIGCGDADLFARAIGTDYYEESSVGEFLLGSKRDST